MQLNIPENNTNQHLSHVPVVPSDTDSSEPSHFSPKKYSSAAKKAIAFAFVALFFSVGLGSAVFLMGQNQDLRQYAKESEEVKKDEISFGTLLEIETNENLKEIEIAEDSKEVETAEELKDDEKGSQDSASGNSEVVIEEERNLVEPPQGSVLVQRRSGNTRSTTSVAFQPLVQKILVIIYDTHLQYPDRPYAYDPTILSNLLAESLEEASIEKGFLQPEQYWHHSPNVDIQIVDTIRYDTPAPLLPGRTGSGAANYNAIIDAHNICQRVGSGEIDEVWLWADRDQGTWEANMAGPENQVFFTNGSPVVRADCPRAFHIMGLNYERYFDYDGTGRELRPSVSTAIHSMGHRIENTLAKFWDGKNREHTQPGDTYYEFDGQTYRRQWVDGQNIYVPLMLGYAGNVHFPPNTAVNYGYRDAASSKLTDFKSWNPQHSAPKTQTSCQDWECFEEYYLVKWMQHIPGRCVSHGMSKANGQPMPNMWHAIYKNQLQYETNECIPPDMSPIGNFENISANYTATGWSCDPDNFQQPLQINFYADGPAGQGTLIGSATANMSREAGVGTACGGRAASGFSFTIPEQHRTGNGGQRPVYAVAINIGQGTDKQLEGSPKSFTTLVPVTLTPPSFRVILDQSTQKAAVAWNGTDSAVVDSWLIERCSGATCSNFSEIATVANTPYVLNTYTDSTSIPSGQVFRYRARAKKGTQLGPYSEVKDSSVSWVFVIKAVCANGSTPANITRPIVGTFPPTPVSWQHQTTQAGTHTLNVTNTHSWSSKYVVLNMNNVPLVPRGNSPHPAITFSTYFVPSTPMFKADRSLPSGTYTINYTAPVAACGTAVNPVPPANFTGTLLSDRRVRLRWSAQTNIPQYTVQRCVGASCTNFTTIRSQSGSEYTSTAIPQGQVHRFRVRANSGTRYGGYSSVVSF